MFFCHWNEPDCITVVFLCVLNDLYYKCDAEKYIIFSVKTQKFALKILARKGLTIYIYFTWKIEKKRRENFGNFVRKNIFLSYKRKKKTFRTPTSYFFFFLLLFFSGAKVGVWRTSMYFLVFPHFRKNIMRETNEEKKNRNLHFLFSSLFIYYFSFLVLEITNYFH